MEKRLRIRIENFLDIPSLEADLPRVALLTGDQIQTDAVIDALVIAEKGFGLSAIGDTLYSRGHVIDYYDALKYDPETHRGECPPVHPHIAGEDRHSRSTMNGATLDFRGIFHRPQLDGPPAVIEIAGERVEMRIETGNIGLLSYESGTILSVTGRDWNYRTSQFNPAGSPPERGYPCPLFSEGENLDKMLRYDPKEPDAYRLMAESLNAVLPKDQKIRAILSEGEDFRQTRGLTAMRGERKIPILTLPRAAQTMAALARTASIEYVSLFTARYMPDIFSRAQRRAMWQTLERLCELSDIRAILATQSAEWASSYTTAIGREPTEI